MTDHHIEESREARDLARSTALLFDSLLDLSSESINRRPAPEEWSPWDIAYHVAQIEVWYFAKLCEAVSAGQTEAMQTFMSAWQHLRIEGIALAGGIPRERLDQPGLLAGVPEWTPRQLIERIAAHDREHAAQVEAAIASEPPSPSGSA